MITREKLSEMNLTSKNGWEWYDEQSEMMFDFKTKELYSHCEVTGELDFICVIKNVEQLEEVVYLNFGDILSYEKS